MYLLWEEFLITWLCLNMSLYDNLIPYWVSTTELQPEDNRIGKPKPLLCEGLLSCLRSPLAPPDPLSKQAPLLTVPPQALVVGGKRKYWSISRSKLCSPSGTARGTFLGGGAAVCSNAFLVLIQKDINSILFFSSLAWRYQTPHRVAFVEKLTKLVLSQLPNFWKLWISYVNGSLFSEVCVQIWL